MKDKQAHIVALEASYAKYKLLNGLLVLQNFTTGQKKLLHMSKECCHLFML